MKGKLIGATFALLLSIGIALYVGIYFCFIGGIVIMFEGFQQIFSPADDFIPKDMALGVARFLLTAPSIYAPIFLVAIPSISLIFHRDLKKVIDALKKEGRW